LERNVHVLLIAIVLICVVVAAWQAVTLGPDNALSRAVKRPSRDLRPYYRKRAFAMLMVTIVAGATADLVVMLGGVFLNTGDVAVLGVTIRLATLVGYISASSQQFVLRDLANAMTRLGKSDVDRLLMRTNITGILTMLAAMAVCLVFGNWMLGIFGPDYQSGYWPLMIFLLSQGVRVLGGMNGHLLALGGHQVRSAALCIGAVAVLITCASVMVPLWGITGMAIATLAAELFWALSLAALTQKLEGRRGDVFGLAFAR
jgi:O-antigen/teichoic acid export membrane protein